MPWRYRNMCVNIIFNITPGFVPGALMMRTEAADAEACHVTSAGGIWPTRMSSKSM